jgi:hypothetical protein
MLYTLFGTDIEKNRDRSRALIATLQEKRPDASQYRLHLENWSTDMFAELTQSIGLFSTKYIILLDNLLTGSSERKYEESDEPSKIILSRLEDLRKSDHIWIIVEDALFGKSTGKELGVREGKALAEIEAGLKKHSDKFEPHDLRAMVSPSSFGASGGGREGGKPAALTSFVFTDAFFDRNPMQAINALTQLSNQEMAAEEIHGALWWQTKAVFQVLKKDTKNLSPFVVSKSSRFLKKWTETELRMLSDQMIEAYHKAHLGKMGLDDALLQLTLTVAGPANVSA